MSDRSPRSPTVRRGTWRGWAIKQARRLAIFLVVTEILACVCIPIFERELMYWPTPARIPPASTGLEGVSEEILATPDGERLVTWSRPARDGQPTLLYFHGNGGSLRYRARRFVRFLDKGYGLYVIAYRGFGGSSGVPSERAIVADAKRAYDEVRRRGAPANDIVLYGESLGASVAVQTAIGRPVGAVVLEAPFTSMVATWRQFVPLVPVGLLLRDQYRTIDVIGRLEAPLLVMHGGRDPLVWPSKGIAIHNGAKGPKRLEIFPDARHHNLYEHGAFESTDRFIRDLRSGALR